MKKLIISLALIVLSIHFNCYAQILSNQSIATGIADENPFLDVSTNFNDINDNRGKGLLFPQTDLTKFTFKTTSFDGVQFPSAFDGMIVFNIGNGNTLSGQGIVTAVSRGFYYFSNPTANMNNQEITQGQWIRLTNQNDIKTPSGSGLPPTASPGDVYYNTDDNNLYYYKDTKWVLVTTPPSGTTLPDKTDAKVGDVYYVTNADPAQYVLKIFNGTDWVPVGVTLDATGENYLSLTGQTLKALPINLAGSNVTGALPATKVSLSTISGITGSNVQAALSDVGSKLTQNTTDIAKKLDANAAITANSTYSIVKYDAKGLVTDGTVPTTDNVSDAASTTRKYVTPTQLTVLNNTSGTNTGDQTLSVSSGQLNLSGSPSVNVVTSLTAGAGLSGTGTTGNITLNLATNAVGATNLQGSSGAALDNGTAGYILKSNGNGTFSWLDISSGVSADPSSLSLGNGQFFRGNTSGKAEATDKTAIALSGFGPAETDINMGGYNINNLKDPTLAQQAATKNYVDTHVPASLVGAVVYKGTYNASTEEVGSGPTNLPNATSSLGHYYVVNTAGSKPFTLNVGDWIISDGTTWSRVANGTVSYTTDLIPEGTNNLYYTKDRVNALIADAKKEDISNKSTDTNFNTANNTYYPTTLAVKTYVDNKVPSTTSVADDYVLTVIGGLPIWKAASGGGVVNSLSFDNTANNGVTGSVNVSDPTKPILKLTLGDLKATSLTAGTINGSTIGSSATIAAGSTLSGSNTGDQTISFTASGDVTSPTASSKTSLAPTFTITDKAITPAKLNIAANPVPVSGSSVLTYSSATGFVWSTPSTYSLPTAGVGSTGTLGGIKVGTGLTIDGGTSVLSTTNNGTVTSVSVTPSAGISGTVDNATSTPAIKLSLGAITPTSIVATGDITGTNLSGTNTGDQGITITGSDITGTPNSTTKTTSIGLSINNNVITPAKLSATNSPTTTGMVPSYDNTSGKFTWNSPTMYTLSPATASSLGGVMVGSGLTIDGTGLLKGVTNITYTQSTGTLVSSAGTGFTFPIGSTSVPSLMLAADKTKLDNLSTLLAAKQDVNNLSTKLSFPDDATSDSKYPSVLAIKSYVDDKIPVTGIGDMLLAGTQDVTGTKTFNNSAFAMRGPSGVTTIAASATAANTITLPSVSGTLALKNLGLDQFASTSSAQLASVISDKEGSGKLVFGTSPTLTTPTFSAAAGTAPFTVTSATPVAGLSIGGNAATATTATNATKAAITDNTSLNNTVYPTWVSTTSGYQGLNTSSSNLTFNPSTGTLTASYFSGSGTKLTNNTVPIAALVGYPGTATTYLAGNGSWLTMPAGSGTITSVAPVPADGLTVNGSTSAATGSGAITLGISNAGIAFNKLATITSGSLLGNNGSGNAALTADQAKALLSLNNVKNVDQTNADNITTGKIATARLGSGTADGTTYLRGDGIWATITAGSDPALKYYSSATDGKLQAGSSSTLATIPAATPIAGNTAGLMIPADKTKLNNLPDVDITNAPVSGQVLTATSATAATWKTPTGGSGSSLEIYKLSSSASGAAYSVVVKSSGTHITMAYGTNIYGMTGVNGFIITIPSGTVLETIELSITETNTLTNLANGLTTGTMIGLQIVDMNKNCNTSTADLFLPSFDFIALGGTVNNLIGYYNHLSGAKDLSLQIWQVDQGTVTYSLMSSSLDSSLKNKSGFSLKLKY